LGSPPLVRTTCDGSRRRVGCGHDEDGSGAGRGEAVIVGGDVVDRIGCDLARVEDDVARERAVEECLVAEVRVSRLSRPGVAHGRAKICVAVADLDDRRIGAVDGDGRRGGRCRRGGRILRHGFWRV